MESVLTGTLAAVAEALPFRFGSGSKLPRSLKASCKPLLPLSQQIRKRFKEVSHGRDLFGHLIGDRNIEPLVHAHSDFNDIERIRTKIFLKPRVRSQLCLLNAQLLDENVENRLGVRFR